MAQCTLDDKTQRQAAERTFDQTTKEDAKSALHGKSPSDSIIDAKREAQAEQADVDNLTKEISEAIPADSTGVQITDAESKQLVDSTASYVMSKADMLERVRSSPEIVRQEIAAMYDELNGTSVEKASFYQNLIVEMDRALVDSSASLKSWASRYYAQTDRPIQNNFIIRSYHAMEAKVRALRSKYHQELRGLADNLATPIAERLGITTDEAMRLLGRAATAKYAPAANMELLRKWNDIIAKYDSMKRGFTPEELREYNETLAKIERYEYYKDDPNPKRTHEADENGTPTPINSGYSDAEAARILSELEAMGISADELDSAARGFSRLYRMLLADRMDAHLVSPEVIEAFPSEQSEYYVPLTNRIDDEFNLQRDGSFVYDPGYFHARDGRITEPDSAYDTFLRYANRASHEIGQSEFGRTLWAANLLNGIDGRKSGLRVYDWRTVLAKRMSKSAYQSAIGEAIEGRGGIIAAIPEMGADGKVKGFEKVLINFDPTFNENGRDGTRITGSMLNDVLSGKVLGDAKADSIFHKATGLYGQLFTRYQPAFAVVNASRDTLERAFHMFNRDVRTEDGTMLSGRSIVSTFLRNIARTNKMLFDYMSGRATGKTLQYGDEYRSMGLLMDYASNYKNLRDVRSVDQIMSGERPIQSPTERMLNRPEFSGMKQILRGTGKNFGKVMSVLDRWNDHFNNSAAFDHYVTLREMGVSAKDAGAAVLEMMNLYQTGTQTHLLRAFFPFVRPTLQSAANMARTLGFTYDQRGFVKSSWRGWATMMGATTVASALIPLIREQLGKDENGNYRLDAMSLGQLSSFVPIGIGDDGSYVKLPTGYGPMQLALTLAYGLDRVQQGTMQASDLAGEVLHSFGKNMLPGNWPEFNASDKPFAYIAQLLSPAIAQPIIEAVTNTSHFGSTISWASDKGQAKAYQGGMGTPAVYHRLAKAIHQAIGWDMSPEQVRSVVGGFAAGPLKIFKALLEDKDEGRRITGKESWAGLHPMLASFGATMWFGDNYNTTRSLFYQAYHAHEAQWKRAGLKLTSNDSSDYRRNKPEEKEAFQRSILAEAGFSEEFINNWIALDQAQSEIRKLNHSSNDSLKGTWQANPSSKELREAFEELAKQYQEIYARTVNSITYYK